MSRLTDIYVRDKWSGEIHRVGDDQHDQLTIWEDGHLHYYNLQNGDGCSTKNHGEGCGYEFVPNVDEYGYNCDPREEEYEQRNSKQHFRNLYQFLSICLKLAYMADERQVSPFDNGLHMGYRAFSGYMRGGVKEIIDLQNDFYGMVFRAEYAERDEKDARDFLQECFGDREIDSINEKDRNRILFLCDKIRREWEENGA